MSARELSLRHLVALVAVDREGSYRRAAEATGYSQAAITQQVAALEKCLGTPVFDRHRGPRPVTLNAAGREVLAAAEDLLARADLLDARLAELREGRWGRLAIGTFQSVSSTVLPVVLAQVRTEEPDVRVTVTQSEDNDELVDGLTSGRLDVAFLVGPVTDQRLSIHEVCRDPFVALVPAGEPPATVRLSELHDVPLIGHADCVCHDMVDAGLRDAGVTPTYVFRSNDNAAVQAMVRAGIGTALMPLLALDAEDPATVVVPLDPALPARPILVAVPAAHPAPTAARFVERALVAGRALSHGRRVGPPERPRVRAARRTARTGR